MCEEQLRSSQELEVETPFYPCAQIAVYLTPLFVFVPFSQKVRPAGAFGRTD